MAFVSDIYQSELISIFQPVCPSDAQSESICRRKLLISLWEGAATSTALSQSKTDVNAHFITLRGTIMLRPATVTSAQARGLTPH